MVIFPISSLPSVCGNVFVCVTTNMCLSTIVYIYVTVPGGVSGSQLDLIRFWVVLSSSLGFCGDSDGKESICNTGDLGSIPGS